MSLMGIYRDEMRPAGKACGVVNVGQVERWGSMIAGGALLALGLNSRRGGLLMSLVGGSLIYRGFTGHCHGYQALGINTADHNDATAVPAQHGFKAERTITVNKPADELYRYWRNLENLPHIMEHLVSVTAKDSKHSHWVATGPLNSKVEWDAEVITEREGEMISWRSLDGSQVSTAGSVRFESAPNGRGTIVRVSMKYDPPAGKVGALVADFLGSGLERQLDESLRRFKQVMETGESATGQNRSVSHPV